MANKKKKQTEEINISPQAITSVIASAAIECYGVVGFSAKNSFTERVGQLLGKKNFSQAIFCKKDKKSTYSIDLYIVVASETKITEVILEIQKKVSYTLDKTFGIKEAKVNVYVQGVLDN